jgi:DNA-binding NarL/FixJ family response regulator
VTRILVADDHDVVRSGLRAILDAQEGWVVVAEAANGQEAVERAIETQPDVAILDYSLPLANGAEVTRQLRVRLPKTEVLIFTMHESEDVVLDLLSAGAKGYLLKSDARRFLIAAVDSLAAHKPFFTGKVSEALLETYLASNRGTILSPRERAVVQLIAEGKSNKVVGDVLAISEKTVESHRAAAMRKLNLDSTAALVRYAVRNKLVEA